MAETDPLAPLIETLYANRRPRVWSLIVTVFGDAVLPRGGELPLGRLQVLLGRVGVEPGTVRTALSRLGRDGWVTRRRSGRTSFYHMSARAEAETRAAMPRIYAAPREMRDWALFLGTPPEPPRLRIGPAAWLAPVPPDVGGAFLTGAPALALPREVLAPEHASALALLERDLAALPPQAAPALSPLDTAAARLLLIHRWRRFALRFPQPLPGADPHARVAAAYGALFQASEAWFDGFEDGLSPLPPRDAREPAPFGIAR